jgi:hypothetical protein
MKWRNSGQKKARLKSRAIKIKCLLSESSTMILASQWPGTGAIFSNHLLRFHQEWIL